MPLRTRAAAANMFPFLRYIDAPAAMEWLARAFGFEKRLVLADSDGSIAHALMRLGPGVIMLSSPRGEEDAKPHRDSLEERRGVYIYVEDVDAHYERAVTAGAEIARELRDTEYGSREYSAWDPEGHLWSFGTYLPDAAPEA